MVFTHQKESNQCHHYLGAGKAAMDKMVKDCAQDLKKEGITMVSD